MEERQESLADLISKAKNEAEVALGRYSTHYRQISSGEVKGPDSLQSCLEAGESYWKIQAILEALNYDPDAEEFFPKFNLAVGQWEKYKELALKTAPDSSKVEHCAEIAKSFQTARDVLEENGVSPEALKAMEDSARNWEIMAESIGEGPTTT